MRPRPFANLKTYRPPKEIPRRGPPGRLHLQYSTRKSGACAGEGLGGGGPRGTGLSLRGGSLRGLLQWGESNGPVPPRASLTVGILSGEGIQAYGAPIPAGKQSLAAGVRGICRFVFRGSAWSALFIPEKFVPGIAVSLAAVAAVGFFLHVYFFFAVGEQIGAGGRHCLQGRGGIGAFCRLHVLTSYQNKIMLIWLGLTS